MKFPLFVGGGGGQPLHKRIVEAFNPFLLGGGGQPLHVVIWFSIIVTEIDCEY